MAGQRAFLWPRGAVIDTRTGELSKGWRVTMQRLLAATGVVEQLINCVELVNVPTDLNQGDKGLLVALDTYNHVLEWEGDHWRFSAGDGGNGFFRTFPAGVRPQEDGWQLCDGSTVAYLVVGGALLQTALFTTPIVANQYFRR